MIEKWLRNEIDKKICNSNRIVILDQTSRWKFLVDAACVDVCLYSTKDYSSKWQQKQDELFLLMETSSLPPYASMVEILPIG